MSAYHQMGHHSNNLVDLPQMSAYKGAIYSPINSLPLEVTGQITKARQVKPAFEAVLDPQLYVPATERGKLKDWAYFPKDVDTADLSSVKWWKKLNADLVNTALQVGADALCSPVIIPKVFDNKFYAHTISVGNDLVSQVGQKEVEAIQTVLCGLADVSGDGRALEIASIVSGTGASRVYLVFVGTQEPRRELSDPQELQGAMRLIYALEDSGLAVTVGFCSSDVVLWKAAGATSCASGKFFNLRRFTRQRFEEPSGSGGGQLPYWFEEGLMAFLRESDLIRLEKMNLLSEVSHANPFAKEIMSILKKSSTEKVKPESWVGLGWRQFLYWFADVESRIAKGQAEVKLLLRVADLNWERIDDEGVLMEERYNNGTWVRQWRNTINDFQKFKNAGSNLAPPVAL